MSSLLPILGRSKFSMLQRFQRLVWQSSNSSRFASSQGKIVSMTQLINDKNTDTKKILNPHKSHNAQNYLISRKKTVCVKMAPSSRSGAQTMSATANPSSRTPNNNKRRRSRRRNQSEVSCCLKYVIFGFNVIFWVILSP